MLYFEAAWLRQESIVASNGACKCALCGHCGFRVEMLHKHAWVPYLRRPQSPHGRSPGGALNKQPRAPVMHTCKMTHWCLAGMAGIIRKGSLI